MDRKSHWEKIYAKPAGTLSWFQAMPTASATLLANAGLYPHT